MTVLSQPKLNKYKDKHAKQPSYFAYWATEQCGAWFTGNDNLQKFN